MDSPERVELINLISNMLPSSIEEPEENCGTVWFKSEGKSYWIQPMECEE